MPHQVKTLVKGLLLPDGNFYSDANTVVTLTDANYQAINPGSFARGLLADLGAIDEWYNVLDFGAKGDGVADDTAAIQNAANTAAGGTLFIPATTFLITRTINLSPGTRMVFAGRKAVLKYTGATDAVAATNLQGLVIEGGGTIDISGAGTSANGIHLVGVWMASIRDMRIIQGPSSSIGVLLETGAPAFGTYCVNIENVDLLTGAGAAGIKTLQSATPAGTVNQVTHVQIINGWCKHKTNGLHISHASTVWIDGFVVDTGTNGYYIEYSDNVTVRAGELGPVSGWAITFGGDTTQLSNITVLAPSYAGLSGTLGYLDTSIYQPTVLDRSSVVLKASPGDNNYSLKLLNLYSYAASSVLRARGGGGEIDILSWGDVTGLTLKGGSGGVRVQSLVEPPIALTDGATITTDCIQGNTFAVTLGGNRTMNNPTNVVGDGQKILYRLRQDATGGRTVTWGSAFRFAGGTAPTLSTAANKNDYLEFVWNAADSKFDCIRTVIGL